MDEKETYFPLSRGFIEHTRTMSGNALRLYLYLLSRARFNPPNKGRVETRAVVIAEFYEWRRDTVYSTLKQLEKKYILVQRPRNRHGFLVIDILKFKSIKDFYSRENADGNPDSKADSRSGSNPDSNPTVTTPNPRKTKGLQTRKKERSKEGKEGKKGGRGKTPKHSFSASPFFDKNIFTEEIKKLGGDIHEAAYWYSRAENYSESSNATYANWIAAVRNWRLMDIGKGSVAHTQYRIPKKKPDQANQAGQDFSPAAKALMNN